MSFFIGVFTGILVAAVISAVVMLGGSKPLDDTDNKTTGARSEMRVLIDHGNGCQYLRPVGGGLTPRLDASGNPICTKDPA